MIREDQAAQALGILVGGTQGWNDEAVAIYLQQLCTLDNPEALTHACQHILRNHTDPGRPSLARILERYRTEISTPQQAAGQLATKYGVAQTVAVHPAEGIEIARAAYQQECLKQNREPNSVIFDVWVRRLGGN